MSSKSVANEIIVNIYERDRSDIVVEPLLVTLVLASFLVFTISYIVTQAGKLESVADSGALAMNVATFLTLGMLIMVSIFFLLMSRNQKHSRREEELRSAVIRYLEALDGKSGRSMKAPIKEMRELDERISSKEKPLSAALWGAIIVAPLLMIAVASFTESVPQAMPVLGVAILVSFIALVHCIRGVTNFSYRHEKAWMEFLLPFQKAVGAIPMPFPNQFRKQVGYRSFLLFFILSLLTGWLFMIPWSYLLLRDMNLHFEEQWAWENCLVQGLRGFELGRDAPAKGQDYEIGIGC